jgi:hypothetical protein
MRGLWRTLAYIAENAGDFNSTLEPLTQVVDTPDLLPVISLTPNPMDQRKLFLKSQPTKPVLLDIDTFLTKTGLVLFTYELAEINRIVCHTKTQDPPHQDLKAYWAGLGQVGPDNRDDNGFMEAVGALAIDTWLRADFATGEASLTKWFPVTADQENTLRSLLQPGMPSDLAAQLYFAGDWPGTSCLSLVAPRPLFTHLNA